MRDPNCIRRQLLRLAKQTYADGVADGFQEVPAPQPGNRAIRGSGIDRALVGELNWPTSSGGKAAVVAFRGTLDPRSAIGSNGVATLLDWLNNTECSQIPFDENPTVRTGRVHKGFKDSLDALWPEASGHVGHLIAGQAAPTIFITGHSKGGAVANLAAMRASELWPNARIRVLAFAGARPGDAKFRDAYQARPNILTHRYEVRLDPVPNLPPGPEDRLWMRQLTSPLLALLNRLGVEADDIPGYVPVGTRRAGGEDVGSALATTIGRALGGLFAGGKPKLDLRGFIEAHSIDPNSGYDRLACSESGVDLCDHA